MGSDELKESYWIAKDPLWEGAILRGERAARCKVYGRSAVSCAKTVEPIEMLFGLWIWVG